MKGNLISAFLVLTMIALIFLTGPGNTAENAHKITVLNGDNPGSKVNIQEHLVAGKINVIDFYSDWCGPCREIAPYLEELNSSREDLVVLKINIGEWGSPVCEQYKIDSVPSFRIYDEKGNLTHEGEDAWNEVMNMLNGLGGNK